MKGFRLFVMFFCVCVTKFSAESIKSANLMLVCRQTISIDAIRRNFWLLCSTSRKTRDTFSGRQIFENIAQDTPLRLYMDAMGYFVKTENRLIRTIYHSCVHTLYAVVMQLNRMR